MRPSLCNIPQFSFATPLITILSLVPVLAAIVLLRHLLIRRTPPCTSSYVLVSLILTSALPLLPTVSCKPPPSLGIAGLGTIVWKSPTLTRCDLDLALSLFSALVLRKSTSSNLATEEMAARLHILQATCNEALAHAEDAEDERDEALVLAQMADAERDEAIAHVRVVQDTQRTANDAHAEALAKSKEEAIRAQETSATTVRALEDELSTAREKIACLSAELRALQAATTSDTPTNGKDSATILQHIALTKHLPGELTLELPSRLDRTGGCERTAATPSPCMHARALDTAAARIVNLEGKVARREERLARRVDETFVAHATAARLRSDIALKDAKIQRLERATELNRERSTAPSLALVPTSKDRVSERSDRCADATWARGNVLEWTPPFEESRSRESVPRTSTPTPIPAGRARMPSFLRTPGDVSHIDIEEELGHSFSLQLPAVTLSPADARQGSAQFEDKVLDWSAPAPSSSGDPAAAFALTNSVLGAPHFDKDHEHSASSLQLPNLALSAGSQSRHRGNVLEWSMLAPSGSDPAAAFAPIDSVPSFRAIRGPDSDGSSPPLLPAVASAPRAPVLESDNLAWSTLGPSHSDPAAAFAPSESSFAIPDGLASSLLPNAKDLAAPNTRSPLKGNILAWSALAPSDSDPATAFALTDSICGMPPSRVPSSPLLPCFTPSSDSQSLLTGNILEWSTFMSSDSDPALAFAPSASVPRFPTRLQASTSPASPQLSHSGLTSCSDMDLTSVLAWSTLQPSTSDSVAVFPTTSPIQRVAALNSLAHSPSLSTPAPVTSTVTSQGHLIHADIATLRSPMPPTPELGLDSPSASPLFDRDDSFNMPSTPSWAHPPQSLLTDAHSRISFSPSPLTMTSLGIECYSGAGSPRPPTPPPWIKDTARIRRRGVLGKENAVLHGKDTPSRARRRGLL